MTANRHLAILCAITLVVVVAAGFATLQRRALTVDPPPAARMAKSGPEALKWSSASIACS